MSLVCVTFGICSFILCYSPHSEISREFRNGCDASSGWPMLRLLVSQASEPESDTASLIGQCVPARRAKVDPSSDETQECETCDPDATLKSISA